MGKISDLFYELLEMLEKGQTDQEISDELGFPVPVIATWRADACLDLEQEYTEDN